MKRIAIIIFGVLAVAAGEGLQKVRMGGAPYGNQGQVYQDQSYTGNSQAYPQQQYQDNSYTGNNAVYGQQGQSYYYPSNGLQYSSQAQSYPQQYSSYNTPQYGTQNQGYQYTQYPSNGYQYGNYPQYVNRVPYQSQNQVPYQTQQYQAPAQSYQLSYAQPQYSAYQQAPRAEETRIQLSVEGAPETTQTAPSAPQTSSAQAPAPAQSYAAPPQQQAPVGSPARPSPSPVAQKTGLQLLAAPAQAIGGQFNRPQQPYRPGYATGRPSGQAGQRYSDEFDSLEDNTLENNSFEDNTLENNSLDDDNTFEDNSLDESRERTRTRIPPTRRY